MVSLFAIQVGKALSEVRWLRLSTAFHAASLHFARISSGQFSMASRSTWHAPECPFLEAGLGQHNRITGKPDLARKAAHTVSGLGLTPGSAR